MDSEAQGALARLNGLLDELDDICESSVGNLESRLSAARSAIKKARRNREGQVNSGGESGAAATDSAARAALEALQQSELRITELEAIARELPKREDTISQLQEQLQELQQLQDEE